MIFSDVVRPESVLVKLQTETIESTLRELVGALVRGNVVPADHQDYGFDSILKREALGTNGCGGGYAIPHAKIPVVDRTWLAIGTLQEAIDWSALDGQPVDVVFLLLSASDRPDDHLQVLELISQGLRNRDFLRFLRQSKTVNEVLEILDEADNGRLD